MAIVRTQEVVYDNGFTGGTSGPCTYTSALTPGSKLIAFATCDGNQTVTFSDTAANTWATVTSRFWTNNGNVIAIGVADNPASSASGVVVTAAWGGSSRIFRSGGIAEYTGLATGAADAFTTGNNFTGTAAVDVAMTTITDGDLILSVIVDEGGTITAGAGYTLITAPNTATGSAWESQVQGTHGSITPAFTISASNQCVLVSAAFKPTAGAAAYPYELLTQTPRAY